LLSEIKSETGLSDFYIYNAERFMEFANANFKLDIEKDSIEQVKRISRERARWPGKQWRLTTVRTILASVYEGGCQICSRKDVEVALIIPAADGGDASIHNALLLCRDHHQDFDAGLFSIDDDFRLLGTEGYIAIAPTHRLNPSALHYHRQRVYRGGPDEVAVV
jgi:putative restriction endonuclease